MAKESKIIKTEAESLLKKIGIDAEVEVKEENDQYQVNINTQENALLIGKHGNTLFSLELILSQIVAQKIGEYKRIIIEVGGYRKDREQYLRDLATRLKEEVLNSGLEKPISGLKSWERRLLHLHFSEDKEVATESQGEERDRVLVIKKRSDNKT